MTRPRSEGEAMKSKILSDLREVLGHQKAMSAGGTALAYRDSAYNFFVQHGQQLESMLSAEPVYYVQDSENFGWYETTYNQYKSLPDNKRRLVYLAPPAPAIGLSDDQLKDLYKVGAREFLGEA